MTKNLQFAWHQNQAKVSLSTVYKAKKIFLEKELFKEKEEWRIEQKQKGFLTTLSMAITKDPTTSIRKRANELKVHEKIVRTAIKQDLSPNHNPLDYTIWSVLENKTNATSHPNIGSLKTAIEKEWNKMSEEFILKACKSFQRHIDRIIEKIVAILIKFTVLCLSSYFVVYFLNQN